MVHNELPKGRADFYIVHNVGSVLEEENQRGLAHFLEHMAFDGSKHFPNDGMDHYIESVGMRGGENFNAYTSFDETVYMVMNAPVDKPAVTDSCVRSGAHGRTRKHVFGSSSCPRCIRGAVTPTGCRSALSR